MNKKKFASNGSFHKTLELAKAIPAPSRIAAANQKCKRRKLNLLVVRALWLEKLAAKECTPSYWLGKSFVPLSRTLQSYFQDKNSTWGNSRTSYRYDHHFSDMIANLLSTSWREWTKVGQVQTYTLDSSTFPWSFSLSKSMNNFSTRTKEEQ